MKRIFGNRGSPEDASDQIFANLALLGRISLGHELVICRRQPGACRRLRFHAALGKSDQRPAHRDLAFLRHTADFTREDGWYRYALTDGSSFRFGRWFASSLHKFIIVNVHHSGALCGFSAPSLSGGASGRTRLPQFS